MTTHPPPGLIPAAALTRALPQAAGPAVGGPAAPGPALGLRRGRVHEICGPARRFLALLLAGQGEGPVVWIAPAHAPERLHAPGIAALIDPARLLLVRPPRDGESLWAAEESLRALAARAAVVVAELPAPPGLTPVRRLHLAAGGLEERGARTSAPLGLLLTPGMGGAPGVESRWHAAPDHAPDHTAGRSRWRLHRLRARGAGPAAWQLTEAGGRHRLTPLPVEGPPAPGWGP